MLYEIRKPQNPDDVAQEYADIQLTLLAEIAKPGSRRVSLEGLGLLKAEYFAGKQTLREISGRASSIQSKYRLSEEETFHLLAAQGSAHFYYFAPTKHKNEVASSGRKMLRYCYGRG